MVAVRSLLDEPRLRSYVVDAAGDEGVRLVKLLEGRTMATDSQLAEELGEKPSHIRKVLYHLFEARIAEYTKEKDKETGWLTFFWHITPDNAVHALEQRRRKEMEALRLQLESERGHDWYACPTDRSRYDFDAATEHDFHCEACGALLEHEEGNARIAEIEQRLRELEAARMGA